MTRRQKYLGQALENVREVLGRGNATRAIYGRLCHTLPILVRTNGLCQTLAFVEEKGAGRGDRARAYLDLRAHIAGTLDAGPPERLLERVRDADLTEYVGYTRNLLEAWTYYKRFAVSILGESGDRDMDEVEP